ncbi:MAG: translation elongation factor Ts [Chloroflexi bacterium]|nr:translation elongation factor Ts [Chloroflexota bacterium]
MAVDAKLVKELREQTGAAVLDSKRALEESDGDIEKAKEWLAEKGLATARKKAGRVAREGVIENYTHTGGRVGVMVEVNCETDFVAATDQFKDFAHDVALHIAFANPQYVDVSDIPEAVLEEEKEALFEEAKESGKPDNIIEKIVEGRLEKLYAEIVLLRQPFVKDEDMTVGELLTKTVSEIKENVQIRRFARFELGETVEDAPEDED